MTRSDQSTVTWRNWQSKEFAKSDSSNRERWAYFSQEVARAGPPDRDLSVLEIGFGNGFFLDFARRKGWTAVGVEADEIQVRRAQAAGFEAYLADRPLGDLLHGKSFDLIVAFDVFEHLTAEELLTYLTDARAILNAGGRIVARFPSGDSPFSGAIFNGDITHKTLIGTNKMRQIGEASGLQLIFMGSPCVPLVGVGLRRGARRLVLTLLQGALVRLLRLAFYGNETKVLTPNAVAILAATEEKRLSEPVNRRPDR